MAESSVRYTRLKLITARVAARGADASFASSARGCLVRSIVPHDAAEIGISFVT